jgi:hypothetical protein
MKLEMELKNIQQIEERKYQVRRVDARACRRVGWMGVAGGCRESFPLLAEL